jgi:DNA polymerase I
LPATGKVAGEDEFKTGVTEGRQCSTPPSIHDVPRDCFERNRVSKPLEGATQNGTTLKRTRDQYLAFHPGQDIESLIVDDERRSRERVELAREEIESHD